MRIDEVSEQTSALFEHQRKAIYVVNASGEYQIVPTGSAELEECVTMAAVAWFDDLAEAARQRVQKGESSPLEYWMYRQRMDVPTLAQAASIWQWRLRRHLRPGIFAKLSAAQLQRYADAMGISAEVLQGLDEQ